jgi:hypothetical protein
MRLIGFDREAPVAELRAAIEAVTPGARGRKFVVEMRMQTPAARGSATVA